jgi:outer membrane protein TolC
MGLAALSLTGCKSLYGTYERPDVNTKGLVRDTKSITDTLAVTDTTSFGNLPWRSVFTDPQLQVLIEKGLANNTDLLNAALNVKMVEAQLNMAKLAFVPSFTFAPSGTIASWDGNKASKTYQLPISASWTVDLFGTLLSAKRNAQMSLLATKDYQLVVKTKIISGVANMYYTLLMLDRQLEIVTDMEGLTKDTWDLMKLQKELGHVRSTGVQSAEANYYSVQAQKADLKRDDFQLTVEHQQGVIHVGYATDNLGFNNQLIIFGCQQRHLRIAFRTQQRTEQIHRPTCRDRQLISFARLVAIPRSDGSRRSEGE